MAKKKRVKILTDEEFETYVKLLLRKGEEKK